MLNYIIIIEECVSTINKLHEVVEIRVFANQGPTGGIYIYNMSIYYLQLFYNITKKMEKKNPRKTKKTPDIMFSPLASHVC
jgi:hypothetical protein